MFSIGSSRNAEPQTHLAQQSQTPKDHLVHLLPNAELLDRETFYNLGEAVNGNYEQPSDRELGKICKRLADGEPWTTVFPGVDSINITAEANGPSISLRLSKNEGMPVQLLKEGEGAGAVVALRRVDELGYYNLGATQLAEIVGLTPPKCRAVIDHLGLREDVECFKEFRFGKSTHGRYAPAAMRKINAALEAEPIEQIWARDRAKRRGAR